MMAVATAAVVAFLTAPAGASSMSASRACAAVLGLFLFLPRGVGAREFFQLLSAVVVATKVRPVERLRWGLAFLTRTVNQVETANLSRLTKMMHRKCRDWHFSCEAQFSLVC